MVYLVSVSVVTDICVKADDRDEAIEKAKELIADGEVELNYMSTLENTEYDVTETFDDDIFEGNYLTSLED